MMRHSTVIVVAALIGMNGAFADASSRGVDMSELADQVARQRAEKPSLAKTFYAMEAYSSTLSDYVESHALELAQGDFSVAHSHGTDEAMDDGANQSRAAEEREALVEAAVAQDSVSNKTVFDHTAAIKAAATGFKKRSPPPAPKVKASPAPVAAQQLQAKQTDTEIAPATGNAKSKSTATKPANKPSTARKAALMSKLGSLKTPLKVKHSPDAMTQVKAEKTTKAVLAPPKAAAPPAATSQQKLRMPLRLRSNRRGLAAHENAGIHDARHDSAGLQAEKKSTQRTFPVLAQAKAVWKSMSRPAA